MSNEISKFLKQYPLLISYAKKGLINLNALAEFIKEKNQQIGNSSSLPAIGMSLRRYISKLPDSVISPIDFSDYNLNLIARSNIQEIVLTKNQQNRNFCMEIINKISKTQSFISVVEGEKEIVLMTDYPLKELSGSENVSHYNGGLSFISLNFPIELRLQIGIYSVITGSLAQSDISIHSFHTIGGEILILVQDKDLPKTQEILQGLI